jgi:superfamily II DNA or RNA helicase
VSSTAFSNYNWPVGHPAAGSPIELRDYQVEVINNFLANPQSIQEVPTGAGKTITTAALSYSVQNYGRSIIIVPNKSLVTQTEADYINVGLDVGVYFGDRKEYGKKHTICTWQSLNNLLKDTKSGECEFTIQDFIEDVVCVMVDECHMVKADALKTLLTDVFSQVPIRWGLTGTIPKAKYEAQALFVSLGNVIGKLSASELQEKGVLAKCHVNIVQLQDKVDHQDYQSELKYLTENSERLDAIANLVNSIVKTGNTLILVDRISAGKEIQKRLSDIFSLLKDKPDVAFVSGETSLIERKEEYDEVATSNSKIIVATYGVASVGINIPRIFNLVLLEPGKSFVRVIQSIGRGIRKAQDKDFVQIWDITSSCKFAKRHLTQRKTFYKEAAYPFDTKKLTYK